MSDLPAHKQNKHGKGILAFVLLVFLGAGWWFLRDPTRVVDSASAVQHLDNLFFAFQSLVQGDILGMIEYLVAGLPVIALFMVVFALVHFITATALKSLFKRRSQQTVISAVVALYALIDPRIYTFMLGLNAFTVGFLVFSVLVIFLWGLSKQGVSSVKESLPDLKNYRMSKKELAELRRQLRES